MSRRLTDWQSPAQLAQQLSVTRLTVYRWITARRVDVWRLSPRCIRVRLRSRDNGRTREPKQLRAARGRSRKGRSGRTAA